MKKGLWLVLALGVVSALGGCSSSARGTISLSWVITVNGDAALCRTGESVEVVARRTSSGKEFTDLFNCTDGSGTVEVPAGTYTLFVYLLDENDNRITTSSGSPITVVKDQNTAVGTVEFAFTENVGGVTFSVHMGSAAVTGGNCNATNPGNGAGVALEEIRVINTTASQCMTFNITGVTNENDQQVTEQTCDPFLCQESSTVHTITGLPNGQYTLQALGYKGATSTTRSICYISNQMAFTVTGGNTPQLGQIFAPFDDSLDTLHLCNATKPS